MKRDLRLWQNSDYRRRGDAIIAAANRNPNAKCWRCGRTLAQHPPHRDGAPAKWTRGHVIDGDPRSPLAAEASTCNYSAGGRSGRAAQLGRRDRRSPNA